MLNEGGKVVQETRGWDEQRGVTVPQRSKEQAEDYRYFPEPDLPPLIVERAWVEEIRAQLPELPDAKYDRFVKEYGLSTDDVVVLVADRTVADYFEATLKHRAASIRRSCATGSQASCSAISTKRKFRSSR